MILSARLKEVLQCLGRGEKGFTLLEIIIAVAITGLISSGLVTAVWHTLTLNTLTTVRMSAVTEAENATYWISRDAQMAETVQVTADADGLPVTLTWVAADGVEHQVVYSLVVSALLREHYSDRASNPAPDVTNYAARSVDTDPAMTNAAFSGGVLTFKVTTTASQGSQTSSQTRTWQTLPRPAWR